MANTLGDLAQGTKRVIQSALELSLRRLRSYIDARDAETSAAVNAAERNAKSYTDTKVDDEHVRAHEAEQALQTAIDIINGKIPAQATAQNQLADKAFVNSSVGTATADFKGTYQSLQELQEVTANANDYAFVIATDAAGNTAYKRYKWVDGTGWTFEYDLNNSSFTAAQWAAIQSGITAALVTKLSELPTNAELNQRVQTAIATELASYYTKAEINALLQTINTSLSGKASQTDLTAEVNRAQAAEQAETARAEGAEDALQALIQQVSASLVNYYLKTETYSKAEVNTIVDAIKQFQYMVADALPEASTDTMGIIYLIPSTSPKTQNIKDEFITVLDGSAYKWEQIGSTTVDLSGYSTTTEMNVAIASALTAYYTKTQVDSMVATINAAIAQKAAQSDLTAETLRAQQAERAEAARAQAAEKVNAAAIAERYTKSEVDTLLSEKQDTLTFDKTPTKGSTNPVTSDGIAKAIEAGQAEPHEKVTVTATANKGDISSAEVTIYDENDEVLATGVGTVSLRLKYGATYKVGGARVYDYLTPAIQTFTAEQIMRDVTVAYTYIERDVVTLDQTISDPVTMLSGDIQGDVIKQIRAASHLYLGTPATQEGDTEGTELICQLDDEDSTKYADGTTAALDGSEGDQWMKLPVFWWKIVGVGEPAEDGAHDQYSFMYAFTGEPDPSWNKWHGDRNLVGAKEMKVIDGKGRSVSGGQSTGSAKQAQYNAYAAARNIGCQGVTWEWQWMMCMLFYAWHGNTNSQAVCGVGSNAYTRTLGVTDALGMTDTTPSQASSLTSAKFWGLEAWWNCKAEWMGNVTMSNYVLNIIDMNTKQARQVAGFVACGGTGGWTSRMRIDANGDFIPLAKEATETTKYCDWVNSNSGSRVLVRSVHHAYANGGVAYVNANVAPSDTYAHIGSRLAFTGVVTEAESVAAYKAALPAGQ